MPKGGHGKSSATSATRKKHAKKAISALGIELDSPSSAATKEKPTNKTKNKEKSGRGGKRDKEKKEVKVKAYIPPVKPARAQPDPLEVGGLARRLPPELVVVLRNVGKKAQVTKIRALEELSAGWIDRCLIMMKKNAVEEEEEDVARSLVEMVPAWMHYVPSLFVHHSRRVRLLAIGAHAGLLKIQQVREQILFYLRETATSEEVESVLGSWCVLVHDAERAVGSLGKEAWDGFVRYDDSEGSITSEGEACLVLNDTSRVIVFGFVQRTVLDPLGVYAYLNPPPPSAPQTPVPGTRSQRIGGPGGKGMSKQQQIAAARKITEEGEPVRSKAEEYEESDTDRGARLRIGGVGGLKWFLESDRKGIGEEAMGLLKNPVLWTILYHAQSAPFVGGENEGIDSFGYGQPNVRKAGWGLLMKLLDIRKEQIEPLMPVLSSAVLRSAWVEPDTLVQGLMWQPLLTFIKEFPNCWDLELLRSYDNNRVEEEEFEGDSGDEEDEDKEQVTEEPDRIPSRPSLAYQDFLQFLQLGCSGSPVQGYPTVVIILSTIPSSIIASSGTRTPLEDLFTSLWAALDGRALSSLHRAVTSAAFLSSALECVVFMARRLLSDVGKESSAGSVLVPSSGLDESQNTDVLEEAKKLVRTQFMKVWDELKSGRLKVEERAAARLVGQNLDVLEKNRGELFDSAWGVLATELRESTRTNPGLVATFSKVLFDRFDTREDVGEVVRGVLYTTVKRVDELFKMGGEGREGVKEEVKFLESMLEQFREGLFESIEFAKSFDEVIKEHAAVLLNSSPSLLFSYLAHRKDEERCLDLWHTLLGVVVSASTSADDDTSEVVRKVASELIYAVQTGGLPNYLKPKKDELDGVVGTLLGNVLAGGAKDDLGVVKAVFGVHGYFISQNGYVNFVETTIIALNLHVELVFGVAGEDVGLPAFEAPLELLGLVTKDTETQWRERKDSAEQALPNVFLLGYLAPQCPALGFDSASNLFGIARGIWEREVTKLAPEQKDRAVEIIKERLRDLLSDTQVRLLPEDILRMLMAQGQKLNIAPLRDVFPSQETLNRMLRQLPHDPIDYSLAAIEPLIPPDIGSTKRGAEFTDSRGFSSYARIVYALLQVFLEDRKLARQNLWALRHFIALSIYAGDYQKVRAGISPVFDIKALTSGLGDIIGRVQQIITYLLVGTLASGVLDGWRRDVVKRVVDESRSQSATGVEGFVEELLHIAAESDSVLDTRVLKVVLEDVLDDVDAEEAEQWLGLARKLERSAPQASMTLVSAITETGAEPSRLDRYRNEQAAALLGIRPNKVNTEGLLTLRRLAASAPDLESDVVFLSQIRAVNVVKACQGWVTADDGDVNEEVESTLTFLFVYLAPILQNVPGAHWEFVWDVLENNLENSSITDDSALVTLVRSLRLVITMEDLVKTNKALRAEWEQRRTNVLKMIRDLALVKLETINPSLPRSICRELVLTILRDLPDSLMDEHTLPKMCHLVTDHSTEVQKLAYGLLRTAAKKRTEHLVIEAGVDVESTFEARLPPELLDIVQRHINWTNLEDEDEQQSIFGSLLGWMLVFDLFQDASFKVKSGYIEQLRNLNLIATAFVPTFLTLLRLEEGAVKAFKLDVWAVNEIYIDLLELGSPLSIPLLAAHLYYRALLSVPSLVYSWLSDCKDRQLSTTVTAYTSQHFSPVLIDAELAYVKGPAGQELSDDSMSVKVASAVNEVSASCLVDEHQLEIKFKIPSDWPLHKIEVKDVKRVGVDENRWRAWVLAVQQTIWSHNGRITDGLSLFKKNVTLHFEGQVECAICYSIISVMDGSLPKKPCKTCKNRFHAGCLYKWFNTSHSSSCPLCRSDIF